jgi:hypothetical protein
MDDELPQISLRGSLKAPNPQCSAKCQCSSVILQSHAIRPRFATSKTRGCYLMRAPSRASCLSTEVSEERDDGIGSSQLRSLFRVECTHVCRYVDFKARAKQIKPNIHCRRKYTAKQHAEAPRSFDCWN